MDGGGVTDAALLDRFRAGDAADRERAFALLLDRHGRDLMAYCLRRVFGDRDRAWDVYQETLVVAWKKFQDPLDEPDKIGGWLKRVARNVAFAEHRRHLTDEAKARAVALALRDEPGGLVPEAADPGDDGQEGLEPEEVESPRLRLIRIVQRAGERLGDDQRALFEQCFVHGRGTDEIAVELGIPRDRASDRVFKLKLAVRKVVRAHVLAFEGGCLALNARLREAGYEKGQPLTRKQENLVNDHAAVCASCADVQKARMVRYTPAVLGIPAGGMPPTDAPADLHLVSDTSEHLTPTPSDPGADSSAEPGGSGEPSGPGGSGGPGGEASGKSGESGRGGSDESAQDESGASGGSGGFGRDAPGRGSSGGGGRPVRAGARTRTALRKAAWAGGAGRRSARRRPVGGVRRGARRAVGGAAVLALLMLLGRCADLGPRPLDLAGPGERAPHGSGGTALEPPDGSRPAQGGGNGDGKDSPGKGDDPKDGPGTSGQKPGDGPRDDSDGGSGGGPGQDGDGPGPQSPQNEGQDGQDPGEGQGPDVPEEPQVVLPPPSEPEAVDAEVVAPVVHTLLLSVSGDGALKVKVNGGTVGACASAGCAFPVPDGATVSLSLPTGDDVYFVWNPAVLDRVWPAGPCAGQSGDAHCTFTATGDVTMSVQVLREPG
ncbi:sigma-70 family RNA polymerase sigma factor [Actinocorallia sp. API 0066]|uniref:RNA polymerase sigma factor n=1 Tax=Actinocorallia sp. API 0066 TaxID=2896846 RepID=UPI001E4BD490|nr:sigma-70 family RNA polymerase sigma factor [Actinocorallia sp. API 0066]MCD0449487.1 sigma-70 family RNA polymerase sigma factor [Actinocorallia sp. API 0066]